MTLNRPIINRPRLHKKVFSGPRPFVLQNHFSYLYKSRTSNHILGASRRLVEGFIFSFKEWSILVSSTFSAGLLFYSHDLCSWVDVVFSALSRGSWGKCLSWVHMDKSSQEPGVCALKFLFLAVPHPCSGHLPGFSHTSLHSDVDTSLLVSGGFWNMEFSLISKTTLLKIFFYSHAVFPAFGAMGAL